MVIKYLSNKFTFYLIQQQCMKKSKLIFICHILEYCSINSVDYNWFQFMYKLMKTCKYN